MRWLALGCLVVVAFGCTFKTETATTTSRTSLFGGKYEFEVEKPINANTSLNHSRTDDGAGKVEELIDYEIGPHKIKVVNGAMTLDGKDCGTIQQGDKIRFTADGKLYVNGVERGQ